MSEKSFIKELKDYSENQQIRKFHGWFRTFTREDFSIPTAVSIWKKYVTKDELIELAMKGQYDDYLSDKLVNEIGLEQLEKRYPSGNIYSIMMCTMTIAHLYKEYGFF